MSRRGITRRSFLASTVAAVGAAGAVLAWRGLSGPSGFGLGSSYLLPGEPLALLPSGKLLDTDFTDPFAGGQMLGYLPFMDLDQGESDNYEIGQRAEIGHDARRVIDVASLLTPSGRATPSDQFFIRTEYPDQLRPPKDWKIKLHGEIRNPRDLLLKEITPFVEGRGPVLLECSGNGHGLHFGLLSVADWAGVPLKKIIELAHPTSKAKAVLINGFDADSHPSKGNHSKPTCSWIFTLDQLSEAGAFLATEMNGRPLPKDQGAPVRLVMPGWYGCTEAKWVDEIQFVDNDQPSTSQMREFSARTLQEGGDKSPPTRARDFRPATIDQAALPVRVEMWRIGDKTACRVVGMTWGGPQRSERLTIAFGRRPQFTPVTFCKRATSNREYGIWVHQWEPKQGGLYKIQLRVEDRTVRCRKLSTGWYDRLVYLPPVA